MPLSAAEIINLPAMQAARVVAGENSLKDKKVEWVSVLETPVENFVRKNEFVLSTGIGCGQSEACLRDFVKEVFESGATLLGLATGRHIYDIPQSVIEFGEQHQFPIIEIPWEIRFADISKNCMDILDRHQKEKYKRSEELQQQLLQLVLSGGDCSDISRFARKELGLPILITDQNGKVKGKAGCPGNLLEKWERYVLAGLIAGNLPQIESKGMTRLEPVPEQEEADYTGINPIETSPLEPETQSDRNQSELLETHPLQKQLEATDLDGVLALKMKIQSAAVMQGWLVVFLSEGKPEINESGVNIIEHAATAAALAFLKDNAIAETEMRLKDDFIWSIASGDIPDKDRMVSRGKMLGFNLSLPYVCIVGELENLPELFDAAKPDFKSYGHWFESMMYYAVDEIVYAGELVEKRLLITSEKNRVIIFFEAPPPLGTQIVTQFLDLTERRLKNFLPGVLLSWGIGHEEDGIHVFKESYEKAKTALDLGRRQKGPGHIVNYEDTKMNRLLLRLSDDSEVREIILSTIAPILQYDKKRPMDLVGTFAAYHRNKGNVSQTARELNLHRQSLLYRLRKIESLTGLSLVNPDDVFLLDLSIKIWSIGVRPLEEKPKSKK
ncbi:PucR family transcriptional regulator [Bacillus marinisedimentorum]|uniref:PucR family transcriptional regulator n=1 Tax=Bacillus marinisedimentorum TaxID=1821260 RepID=UPI0007E22474|nr:PucR family transcriptional regulator [Bacillus marinisedimentorum]